jgi:hypothetical protein
MRDFSDGAFAATSDNEGNLYLAGGTRMPAAFPAAATSVPSAKDTLTGIAAYVLKLDPTGAVVYAVLLGGTAADGDILPFSIARSIALDPSGGVVVAGTTTHRDFLATTDLRVVASDVTTGFVVKLSADGATIDYAVRFGGGKPTFTDGMAIDAAGNVHLSAETSASLPVTPGTVNQRCNTCEYSGYALGLGADGSVRYATYLPVAGQVATDNAGRPVFAGQSPGQSRAGTVLRLSADGSRITDSATFLPVGQPSSYDETTDGNILGLAIDPGGGLYVSGWAQAGTALPSSFTARLTSEMQLASRADGPSAGGVVLTRSGKMLIASLAGAAGLPVIGGNAERDHGGTDGYWFAIPADQLTPLLYASYVGGSDLDLLNAVAVTRDSTVVLAGETKSCDIANRIQVPFLPNTLIIQLPLGALPPTTALPHGDSSTAPPPESNPVPQGPSSPESTNGASPTGPVEPPADPPRAPQQGVSNGPSCSALGGDQAVWCSVLMLSGVMLRRRLYSRRGAKDTIRSSMSR